MRPVFPSEFLKRRHLLLVPIVLAHLLALLALIWARVEPVRPVPRSTLRMIELGPPEQRPAAARSPPEKAEVVRPEPLVELPVEPPIAAAAEVVGAAPSAKGAGGGCDLVETVRQAITADVEVRAALARIAPEARSVANAVPLWNARWADPAVLGGTAVLEPIRRGIVASVRAAPPECLPGEVAGPRFIAVEDPGGTIVLVLGSGRWTWAQLLAEDAAVSAGPPQ